MMGYIALCDLQGNVIKIIQHNSADMVHEGQNVKQLFCDAREMDEWEELLRQDSGHAAYGSGYYEIQKVNNQLINSQRELAKANARLKIMLEEARQARDTIEHLERDPLTGLFTERVFYERAGAVLEEDSGNGYDIVAVDIERFKMVNDAFGSAAGDQLLKRLADCLLGIPLKGKGLFARARADMFFGLVAHEDSFYEELDRRLDSLAENPRLPMRIQIKAGIYPVEDRRITVPRMCDRALLASASIKGLFNCRCAVYDESMRQKMVLEQKVINTMEESLEREEFHLFLQPKVEIETGRLIGAEVLVRWDHPEYGRILPGDFIPIFEKNGFIYALDQYAWRKACRMLERWKKEGMDYVPVSVNVSRADIYHGELPEILAQMVEESGLEPGELHLEITESAYVTDSRQLMSVVDRLRQLGFVIEMDDFGKGYSSLNTLSELPIDVLKLDLEFLKQGVNVLRRQQIMRMIVNMAKELQLQVIAEGVETGEQTRLLKQLGFSYAQGYYYGRPVPQEEFFHRYLRQRK